MLFAVYLVKAATGNGDFKIFLGAAKLVAEGKNPYHEWIFVTEGNFGRYFYSPLWAVMLIPFTWIPQFVSNLIWLLANAFFLYRIGRFLISYAESISLTSRQSLLISAMTIAMSFRFILYNLGMIQMTIFLLWGIMESLHLFGKDKYLPGGLLLALVINIKLLPLVLLPYLFYRNAFKPLLSTISFSFVLLLLPAMVSGWSFNSFLLSEWWSVINPFNPEHLLESELGPHSLTALVPSLLTETEGTLEYRRNILNLDNAATNYILNGVRVLLIIFTLFFLRWPPFSKVKFPMQQLQEVSYILLLIPLIFPHQQKYAFLMILPAQFYLACFVVYAFPYQKELMSKTRWTLIVSFMAFSFLLMTLTTDGLIGRELNRWTQHYKAITYGALLLMVPLALCSHKYLESATELRGSKI
jgi:Glycosyltransferase family 87